MRAPRIWPELFWFLAILCVPAVLPGQQATPRTIKIPDGTSLRLSLRDSLSSATNEVDDPIDFEVTEDVKVGDVVVFPRGTSARGHVVVVEPKKRLGRAGKLNFSVDNAKAPDGTNVRLRASSVRKGEEKSDTVILGTLFLGPLAWMMRGKDVNIPKGTNFNAYVDGDRDVALGGPAAAPAAAPAPAQPVAVAPPPAPVPEELSTVVLKSTPDGADVTVDGKFMGSTPSTVRLTPGDHRIAIEKSGYKIWQNTMTLYPGGIVTVDATLERIP